MKELEKMPLKPTEKSIPVDCLVEPMRNKAAEIHRFLDKAEIE